MMITCSSCGQAIQADDAAYRAHVPLYEPVTAPDGAPAARLVGYSQRLLCRDCVRAIEDAAERRRAIRRAAHAPQECGVLRAGLGNFQKYGRALYAGRVRTGLSASNAAGARRPDAPQQERNRG